MNKINIDKMVKAKTFKTALKQLSKLVQKNDGEVFYISDILFNYEEGVKKWNEAYQENEQKEYYCKLSECELREKLSAKYKNEDNSECSRTLITPFEYYDYWKNGDDYFRINIELRDGGSAYIDCGYCTND